MKLKTFGQFALPDYPVQTEPSEDNDEWVTGDGAKPYTWNGSKDTDANLNDMSKEVEKDRK